MTLIKEYLRETTNFNKRVEDVTEFLNTITIQLNELITLLENIFDALKRSNNLISFLKNYSRGFETQMVEFSETLKEIKEKISIYQNQLSEIEQIIKLTQMMTDKIEDSAHSFIKFARKITYLAENIEVKAYQAREEGRGLTVISREVFKIAKSSQILFQHFDELLDVIRKNVEPLAEDISVSIKDASISSKSLLEFLASLKEVSDLIESLQKFIRSMEVGGEIFSELEIKINERVASIKEQLFNALNTIDGISIHSSEIVSLSQILYELHSIINIPNYNVSNPFFLNQFTHLLNENVKVLKRLSIGVKPTLLSSELRTELNNIINQVDSFYELIISSNNEVEKLNIMMGKISGVKLDINQVFAGQQTIVDKIKDFKRMLEEQLTIIENLVEIGSKVIIKIKTLSILSRLEQSRSLKSSELIIPIVAEFNHLLDGMNLSFNTLESNVTILRNFLSNLMSIPLQKEFIQLALPDFLRIKIFFDDTLRAFESCLLNTKNLKVLMTRLDKENSLLQQQWNVYEESLMGIINFGDNLQRVMPEKVSAPHIVHSRKILKINLLNDPVTLKPDLKTDATSQQVIVNCSAGIFQFGFGTGVIPCLCDEYSVSDDGREYLFHLRENLEFANGKKLHIEDIKTGILRGLNGPNHNLLEMISGAREFFKSKDVNLLAMKIVDQHRIWVKLEYPYLPFLANFATNIADPYIDGELPIGMGPFRLLAWNRGKDVILEANEFYFEGRPSIDELQFIITVDDEMGYELFKKGELSIYQPGQKSLRMIKQEKPELLITTPELSVHFLCFNCQKPPFNNKLVRQALCYGIDVQKFVNDLLTDLAIPAKGVFPPSIPVYNKELAGYNYNPTKSKELLTQAGFSYGLPDTYPLDVSDTPASIKRAEFIKKYLSDIGVKVEINPLPWHDFLERCYKGKFLLCLQGWISDTGDPDNFLYPLFHTNSFGYAGNTFFFSNVEIDRMIENARQIRNTKQRINYYHQIEEKILDEAPGVFLFHSLKNIVVKKNIRGFKPHPLSIIRAKYIQPILDLESKEILLEKINPQFAIA